MPIVYGLIRLDEAGKEAAQRGDFVLGGCCFESESWYCKECKHSFCDPAAARPALLAEAERDSSQRSSHQESGDSFAGRFIKQIGYLNGAWVTITKAPPNGGYFVIVDYPNGERTTVKAQTRGEANRMADAYGRGENPLEA